MSTLAQDPTAALQDQRSAGGDAGPVVAATDLYRFYHAGDEEVLALRGVSLRASAGQVVAVVGPSGSGKSTLLSCLAGLDEPDGGTVTVAGQRLTRRSEAARAALRARLVGVLFQSGNLLAHLDVAANVELSQRLVPGAARTDAGELLGELGIAGRAHAMPATLSGGEGARAGLAVALANAPSLLIADEPSAELDAGNEQRLLALLRRRAEAGLAVVVSSHSPAVLAWADAVVELRDGRVAETATAGRSTS